MNMKKFDAAVIGGDRRTAYMVLFLEKRGYRIICYGTQMVEGTRRETANSLRAVSYTHLDVYKRQVLRWATV